MDCDYHPTTGLLEKVTYRNRSHSDTAEYLYDAVGQLVSMGDWVLPAYIGATPPEWEYDGAGKILESHPGGMTEGRIIAQPRVDSDRSRSSVGSGTPAGVYVGVHGIQGYRALRALHPWLPSVTPPGSIGSASGLRGAAFQTARTPPKPPPRMSQIRH